MLSTLLKECLVGQKRTGKSKQFVFLNRGTCPLFPTDLILKGPYTNKARLDLMFMRKSHLQSWALESRILLLPVNSVCLDSQWYVKFPCLLKQTEFAHLQGNMHTEGFSPHLTYRVLDRTILVKLSDFLQEHGVNDYVKQQAPELLFSFILCFLLSVGDMHLSNVLYHMTRGSIHLIDMEETRIKDSASELFYFTKEPNSQLKQLWLTLVRPHYRDIHSRLQSLIVPDGLVARKNKALDYLTVRQELPVIEMPIHVKNKGKMQLKGLRAGSVTFSGFTLDLVKSGMQKYVRRGIIDKALICMTEMYRLEEMASTVEDQRNAKAIRTNLINRIRIISAEDVGIADLGLVLAVLLSLEHYNYAILVTSLHALCLARKTRVASHIWRAYAVPIGRVYAGEAGLLLDNYGSGILEGAKRWPGLKDKDPESIHGICHALWTRLLERDIRAVGWAAQLLEQEVKVAPRYRRALPDAILWAMLEELLPVDIYKPLYEVYWQISEKRPFFMLAILAHLHGAQVNIAEIKNWLKSVEDSWQGLYDDLLFGNYELKLDSYVIDKHTMLGMQQGSDRNKFVKEGAYIENEAMEFSIPLLKEIYEK